MQRQIDHAAAEAAHAALLGALARKAMQPRDAERATEARAIAGNGIRGYSPQHGPNGGECHGVLDTLPVLLKYELTWDGAQEIAEVTEVGIGGHVLEAGNFAADLLKQWGLDCMASRGGL